MVYGTGAWVLASLALVSASRLTLNTQGSHTATIAEKTGGGLAFTGTKCVDRSTWCAPYADTRCAVESTATVVSNVNFNVNVTGARISIYSDGVVRFESPTCVGVDMSGAPLLPASPIVRFGATGSIYIDNAGKMWISTPGYQLVDSMTQSQCPGAVGGVD